MNQPRDNSGRYDNNPKCDCCGKPCRDDHMTDDRICGDTDYYAARDAARRAAG